jgi:hypothetical protein
VIGVFHTSFAGNAGQLVPGILCPEVAVGTGGAVAVVVGGGRYVVEVGGADVFGDVVLPIRAELGGDDVVADEGRPSCLSEAPGEEPVA